ncbi:MAG: hypothetical protein ACYTA3_12145, partial [Planctomycetota bacterium]
GIGAWHLMGGRIEEAYTLFQAIVDGDVWPAFGYIAAEAELARWMVRARPLPGSTDPTGPAASGSP